MIGVISKKSEVPIVKEFFQLFKVPWEFYTSSCSYDVVLSTRNDISELSAKLVVIYSSETGRFDSKKGIHSGAHYRNLTLVCDDIEFPVYGNILDTCWLSPHGEYGITHTEQIVDLHGLDAPVDMEEIMGMPVFSACWSPK